MNFIVMTVPDKDEHRPIIAGPYTRQEAEEVLKGFLDSTIVNDPDEVILDELDDTVPHIIVCGPHGLPTTFTITSAILNFKEAYAETF